MAEIKNGCLGVGVENTDYLLSGEMAEGLPDLYLQDTQIYEYNQGTTPHCTLYSAFGAVSDLFNYQWKQSEIDEMVEESYNRGRTRGEGRYIKSAVDLVADYWNGHHSDLGKVVYYRVSLYDTELVDKILEKNYTLCSGYRGNSKYNSDFQQDAILNGTTFGAATYGHAVSWIGRSNKRYIKDNYKGRKTGKLPTNIYEVEHEPKELVSGNCYYTDAYLYTKVQDLEEVKRLNKMKTLTEGMIADNSEMRHLTNDPQYQAKLHDMNNTHRGKLKDIEDQLKKYL